MIGRVSAMTECALSHRLAATGELAELGTLMASSIRTLIGAYLDTARVEASFEIMGLDTQLIEDGTYFVVECERRIAGCGGWSRRATLFGGEACGFSIVERIEVPTSRAVTVPCARMAKPITAIRSS